ncbi:MAG: hypothetical protein ACRERE_21565 [Candidatus Entotheonellia bacterium]
MNSKKPSCPAGQVQRLVSPLNSLRSNQYPKKLVCWPDLWNADRSIAGGGTRQTDTPLGRDSKPEG